MEKLVMLTDNYRKLAAHDSTAKGIIVTTSRGLESMYPDEAPRCCTCDSRNCGLYCHAAVGTVYVVTFGYRAEAHAKEMEALGAEVRWDDKGFVAV
jgi:hypothetical protein